MKNFKKKPQSAFHRNFESMTLRKIEVMTILDSENYIRFLQDPTSGFYIVFDGRFNSSFYARSYQAAERKFLYLVTLRESEILRRLDNWILCLDKDQYVVLAPNNTRHFFLSKSKAEHCMLLNFYKAQNLKHR